jgi:hypothetical protein
MDKKDICLYICNYLDVNDISQLLSTCKRFDYIQIEKSTKIYTMGLTVRIRSVRPIDLIEIHITSTYTIIHYRTIRAIVPVITPIIRHIVAKINCRYIVFIDKCGLGRVMIWYDTIWYDTIWSGNRYSSHILSIIVLETPADMFDLIDLHCDNNINSNGDMILDTLDMFHLSNELEIFINNRWKMFPTHRLWDICNDPIVIEYICNI